MTSRRHAITLIEVLILTVIIAIVAGTIMPEFSASARDTKLSNLKYNLHLVRAQLEQYRDQHGSTYPKATTSEQLRRQLTQRTTIDGNLGAGAQIGPYLDQDLPENPFNGSSRVTIISGDAEPTTATGGTEGWQYNAQHGWFFPNCSEYFQARGGFSAK